MGRYSIFLLTLVLLASSLVIQPALADGPLGINLGSTVGELPKPLAAFTPGICSLSSFNPVGLIWRIKKHNSDYACAQYEVSDEPSKYRVTAIFRDGRVVFAFMPFAEVKSLFDRLSPVFSERYGKPIQSMEDVYGPSGLSGAMTKTSVDSRLWRSGDTIVEMMAPILPASVGALSSELGMQRYIQENASHLLYADRKELRILDSEDKSDAARAAEAAKRAEQDRKADAQRLKKKF
jgi:hypothetical protein